MFPWPKTFVLFVSFTASTALSRSSNYINAYPSFMSTSNILPYFLNFLLIWCSSTCSERPPRKTLGFFGLPPPCSLFCLEERALALSALSALSREADLLDLDVYDRLRLGLPLWLRLLSLLLRLLSRRVLLLLLLFDLLILLPLLRLGWPPRLTRELETSTLFIPLPKMLVLSNSLTASFTLSGLSYSIKA